MDKTPQYLLEGFIIILFILATAIVSGEQGKFYMVSVDYDNGALAASAVLNDGYFSLPSLGKDLSEHATYFFRILSINNSKLYSGEFNIPLFAPDIGGVNKTSVTLSLPYFDTAKEIRIYNASYSLVYALPVDFLSDQNKIKPYLETLDRFSVNDKVCNGKTDGICDLDCSGTEDTDCKKYEDASASSQIKTTYRDYISFAAIALILIILYLLNRRKNRMRNRLSNQ